MRIYDKLEEYVSNYKTIDIIDILLSIRVKNNRYLGYVVISILLVLTLIGVEIYTYIDQRPINNLYVYIGALVSIFLLLYFINKYMYCKSILHILDSYIEDLVRINKLDPDNKTKITLILNSFIKTMIRRTSISNTEALNLLKQNKHK